MPRRGSIPADIVTALKEHGDSMPIAELVRALNDVRRFPVSSHSVRSALYQHLDYNGEQLFVRVGRGRYSLQR